MRKNEISEATHNKLKNHLRLEYDFYYFVKQRFYNLLSRIRSLNKERELDQQLTHWWSPAETDDSRRPSRTSYSNAENIKSQDIDRTRKLGGTGVA